LKVIAFKRRGSAAEEHQMSMNVLFLRPNVIDKLARRDKSDAMNAKSLPARGIDLPRLAQGARMRSMSRRTRAVLWLTLVFWSSTFVLLTLGTALSGNPNLAGIAEMRVLTALLGLGFCYLIHLLLTHRQICTTKRRLIALAVVAPVAAEVFAWASYFAEGAADPSLLMQSFSWPAAVRTVAFWTWFFLAWSALYLVIMYSFDIQEAERRASELKEQAHVAQLRALHSQINPHFLFNSLNSVSALILDESTELAEEMVVKLARFLRLGLAADPTSKIPLSAEVELQRSYLEIERLRYPDLDVEISIPENLHEALVPSLVLQPIIENSIKYGVAGAPPPAAISICGRSEGNFLFLEVTDSGRGASNGGGAGIGLNNVRQRLELLYLDGRPTVTAGRNRNGEYRVEIAMPLELP
jgi:hypothetical protein